MTEALAKILVADDEPDLRALLQRYLSDQGYSVRTVDGAGPLDVLLQRERFDVLVLDVMMPGEDGLSICRRLRAQGETIPILMLTARGDPVDRIVGLEMGADDYLPKPFNPQELLASKAMNELLDTCLRDYDVTIVDTPPGNSSADARRIAMAVRYAMLVAKKDDSFVGDVKKLADELTSDRATVIGTFLNDF